MAEGSDLSALKSLVHKLTPVERRMRELIVNLLEERGPLAQIQDNLRQVCLAAPQEFTAAALS